MKVLQSPLRFALSLLSAFICFPVTCIRVLIGFVFMIIDSVVSFVKSLFSKLLVALLGFFPHLQTDAQLQETKKDNSEEDSVIAFLLTEKKELEEQLEQERMIKKKAEQEIQVLRRKNDDQDLLLGKE